MIRRNIFMALLTLSALVERAHAEKIGHCPTIPEKITQDNLIFDYVPLLGLKMAKIEKKSNDTWLVKCVYPNKIELQTSLTQYTSCYFNSDPSQIKCVGADSTACMITCE